MSNPKANFYANELFDLLKQMPQLPLATYPGHDWMGLDFSALTGVRSGKKAYEIYENIMTNDGLGDLNYTNRMLMSVEELEFYFITSEQFASIEQNVNEAASCILRYYRCYEYAKLEAAEPKNDLIRQFLVQIGDVERKKFSVYGPCVLLPRALFDNLVKKKN